MKSQQTLAVSCRFRVFLRGVYHSLAFLILWRRAQPRQFEGAAPEDDTKGELRRNLVDWWSCENWLVVAGCTLSTGDPLVPEEFPFLRFLFEVKRSQFTWVFHGLYF